MVRRREGGSGHSPPKLALYPSLACARLGVPSYCTGQTGAQGDPCLAVPYR